MFRLHSVLAKSLRLEHSLLSSYAPTFRFGEGFRERTRRCEECHNLPHAAGSAAESCHKQIFWAFTACGWHLEKIISHFQSKLWNYSDGIVKQKRQTCIFDKYLHSLKHSFPKCSGAKLRFRPSTLKSIRANVSTAIWMNGIELCIFIIAVIVTILTVITVNDNQTAFISHSQW